MSLHEHVAPSVRGTAYPYSQLGLGEGRMWKVAYRRDGVKYGCTFQSAPEREDEALALIRELRDTVGQQVQYTHSDQAPDAPPRCESLGVLMSDDSLIDVPYTVTPMSYLTI